MVNLKRKAADGGGGDEDDAAASKRKVDELMKLAASTSSSSSQAGPSSSRQMQGQSAESGMHSIDSDEEEEYVRSKVADRMAEDDFEGVEDATPGVDRDGEIQITPFNLKDVEEDGHFAKDGNFIWKKAKEDEATDSWLEGVDWGKVEARSQAEEARREAEDDAEEKAEAEYDETASYRSMLVLLRPGESVARALRRLGGGKKTTAQKLKEKKRQKEGKETEEEKRAREDMARLTGLADAVLTRSGHMEVYEETHESIAYRLKEAEERARPAATEIPDGADADDALDMFMDSAKKNEGEEGKAEKSAPAPALSVDDDVKWEFRWEDSDSSEVHGPHTSKEMLEWQESGFFSKGVFVRKAGAGEDFRDGKRIDFELYT